MPLHLILCCIVIGSLSATPVITEFLASNKSGITDLDGDHSDWIEIHNPTDENLNLTGFTLSDDAGEPSKWGFPAGTILGAGEYLVVFASRKDRTGLELHTNFQLKEQGEYLALHTPEGSPLTQFSPAYPPQFRDLSFGKGNGEDGGNINLTPNWSHPGNYANIAITGAASGQENGGNDSLDSGTGGAFSQFYLWFDFSGQLGGLPPGSTVTSAQLTWSADVPDKVFGNATVPTKVGVYPVPDNNKGLDTIAKNFTGADIRDYTKANSPIASATLNPDTSGAILWDISALVQDWIDQPAAPRRGQLILLNDAAPFFAEWQVNGESKPTLSLTIATSGATTTPLMFLDSPTPGSANTTGQIAGPVISDSLQNPPQPVLDPLTITTRVQALGQPVNQVSLIYRQMFGAEKNLAMKDDGQAPDVTANDGIYSVTLPPASIVPGEMTRWRIVATDALGAITKDPPFREAENSPEYFGTVGHDPTIETNLTVLHWFIQDPRAADRTYPTGNRGAHAGVYYRGKFYDNVGFKRHGQSTGGFPKKSYNIDFNTPEKFIWNPDEKPVSDIDLLTNWADKSKVRHSLAYEVMRKSGVGAHFAYTVRVHRNGSFFSTADFVEDPDETYLERAGLNPEGALYKIYDNRLNKDNGDTANDGVEKKNRKDENNADLAGLIDGLDLSGSAQTNYLYDNIDLPKTINMLAANSVIRNIDMHRKNWYLYRDTGETDEWAILPWDLDLSHGRVWNSTNRYFDNGLFSSGFVSTGTSIRLVSLLNSNPQTRSMLLRRIRTLSDRFLQEPGTPYAERFYENRLDDLVALIDDPAHAKSDARLDFEKWGSWVHGGGTQVPFTTNDPDIETMSEALDRWKNEYLPARRNEIYNNQTVGNGGEIPSPQDDTVQVSYTSLVTTGATTKYLVPANNSAGASWLGFSEPFDDSTWQSGTTPIGYERGSGYQDMIATDVSAAMSHNNSLYLRIPFVARDIGQFDSLELRVQYDDGFIAFLNGTIIASDNAPTPLTWNSASDGLHEASAGAFDLFNANGALSSLREGENILTIQSLNQGTGSSDFIINAELHAGTTSDNGPAQPTLEFGDIRFSPTSGNQDEEFVELRNPHNSAVDISDWTITGGIDFTFQPGTVIPAKESLYLSPEVNSFRSRPESPTGGEGHFVQGGYRGHLSSFGETLTLRDDEGILNQEITYEGNPSDAQLSLVISELMYHPEPDGRAEFIELLNISQDLTLDLTGVRFTDGIEFDFTGSSVTELPPGERVMIARDLAAFTAAYGNDIPVAGVFANGSGLSNGGETIKLKDAQNATIREFTYDDSAPWNPNADSGYSLVLISPTSAPEHDDARSWRMSTTPGGNPGGSDTIPAPADPLADPDQNGLSALVEYALGTNLGSEPHHPEFDIGVVELDGSLQSLPVISYPRSIGAEKAGIKVEISTDLQTWDDSGAFLIPLDSSIISGGREFIRLAVKRPPANSGRLFYRLNVSLR